MIRHRKMLVTVAAAALAVSLAACGGNTDTPGNIDNSTPPSNSNSSNAADPNNSTNTNNSAGMNNNTGNAGNMGGNESGSNEQTPEATPESKQGTGIWVGLIDNHSAEIKIDGTAEAFELSESVQSVADGLNMDESVEFEYVEQAIEGEGSLTQKTITKLSKTSN